MDIKIQIYSSKIDIVQLQLCTDLFYYVIANSFSSFFGIDLKIISFF